VSDLVRHWNEIFAAKDDPQLGWYEADVAQTIRFLDSLPAVEAATIFLPGAGTSLLVDELLGRGARADLLGRPLAPRVAAASGPCARLAGYVLEPR
jgi:hypothetical protein